jgi:hypothetical protein
MVAGETPVWVNNKLVVGQHQHQPFGLHSVFLLFNVSRRVAFSALVPSIYTFSKDIFVSQSKMVSEVPTEQNVTILHMSEPDCGLPCKKGTDGHSTTIVRPEA